MSSQETPASRKQAAITSRSITSSNPPSPSSAVTESSTNRPKSYQWHVFSQILCLLWLGPIITLLVLNFRNHIIGASIWCPFGKCFSDAFGDDAIATAVRLDKWDHDLLASLQFVAQAFEIWFLIIATALLYDVGMIFARSPGGFPVGYLLTYLEFSDVKNLVNPLLWTSALPPKRDTPAARKHRGVTKLFLFALLAAFLTILTNLMGAATAVLLIPSLSWVETKRIPQQIFDGIASAQAPQGDSVFAESCTNAQLSAGNFSCTSAIHGPSLDEWAATALSSTTQFTQPCGAAILGTSQESAVQFALNGSTDLEIIWVANRQVLRELSRDYLDAIGVTHNYLRNIGDTDDGPGDPRYNRSLQTILQWTGPSIGVQANCYVGNVSVTKVAEDKEVHCFSDWSPDEIYNYTKCFRIGEGFNTANAYSRFWLGTNTSATAVDAYTSDLATYYNETTSFNSGILPCLSNTTAPTCNWDAIFRTPLPRDLFNSSVNVGLISYSIPNPPTSDARIYCDSVGHLSFPTYTLDTSIETNMLHLVQLDNFTTTDQINSTRTPIIAIHPSWLLSAYSVNANGTIPHTRPIADSLTRTLKNYYTDPSNDLYTLQLFLYHIYTLGQAISLIPYNYTPLPPLPSSSATTSNPISNPVLTSSAHLHVWAWSLSARTSKLGVVITSAGCMCVLAQVVVRGLFARRREVSGVEMLMGMEEEGRETHEGVGCGVETGRGMGGKEEEAKGEREMARWRCRVREGDGGGRARFVVEGVAREG